MPSAQVAAAFAKGSPRVETDGYKVHASRREAPGMAEVHERDTDIIYALEGSAPIVTGGPARRRRGALIKGFNAPNRVVLTRDARPGQRIQIAVFAANGRSRIRRRTTSGTVRPRSTSTAPPPRTACRHASCALTPPSTPSCRRTRGSRTSRRGSCSRKARSGCRRPPPVQRSERQHDLSLGGGRRRSGVPHQERLHRRGYRGVRPARFERARGRSRRAPDDQRARQPARDPAREERGAHRARGPLRRPALQQPERSRLRLRRVSVLHRSAVRPGEGLDDPRKELAFSGTYHVSSGIVRLVSRELSGPNGIALSPDQRYFYVGNWDEKNKVVMRYGRRADGTAGRGQMFFDMTGADGEDAIAGVKTDARGNVYASGPGGLWIIAPDGRHLGTIAGPEHIHNFAWGDADRRTLYLTARNGLYRMRLETAGVRAPIGTPP